MRRIVPAKPDILPISLKMRNLAISEIRSTLMDEINHIRVRKILEQADRYEFPDFFRIIRGSLRLTQSDIAALMGCSVSRIRSLEKGAYGKCGPRPEFIAEWATLFGIDYYYLYEKWRIYQRKRAGTRTNENKAI